MLLNLRLISEPATNSDVCGNTEVLTTVFLHIQQEGGSIQTALKEEGYSLVKCDKPPGFAHAKVMLNHTELWCMKAGDCYVVDTLGDYHEVILAPPA